MRSGNLKDLQVAGKRLIEVSEIPWTPEFPFKFTASVIGWHRGDHLLGAGQTGMDAVHDLRRKLGKTEGQLSEEFELA
jgi:hypothetical protein